MNGSTQEKEGKKIELQMLNSKTEPESQIAISPKSA